MASRLLTFYSRTVLSHPALTLLLVLVVAIIAGLRLDQFRLDASPDSLVMEGDDDYLYYQQMTRDFTTSDSFLVISFQPEEDLFSDDSIDRLTALRDDLADIEGVRTTNSILNVPLLHSPDISLTTVSQHAKYLDEDDVPLEEAKESLLDNPLYPNLLISEDASTTAIQLLFPIIEEYRDLQDRRNELRDLRRDEGLDGEQRAELEQVEEEFRALSDKLNAERDRVIAEVRTVLDEHRDGVTLHLGGVPMIVADMISFVENDLVTFGLGVLLFIIATLTIIFRQVRWVLLPLACCSLTVWLTLGYLGWTQWPVTVISSNFISLLLIITLSLTVHLIVRYREYQQLNPDADRRFLITETVQAMAKPCFYMALTTIVAFGSLFFSDIRPVIDFGLMMTVGISIAFFVVFLVLPSTLMLLPKAPNPGPRLEKTPITAYFARFTDRRAGVILGGSAVLAVFCVTGVTQLSVENRFIDYFKSDTEIHRGMLVIDEKLGGTTPLDVIVKDRSPGAEQDAAAEDDPFLDDGCDSDDPFLDDGCEQEAQRPEGFFNSQSIAMLREIQEYLDDRDETGKVISLVTTVDLAEQINQGQLNPLQLGLMGAMFPDELRDILLTPYVSKDEDKARFSIRLIESNPDLEREALFQDIRNHLTTEVGLEEDQVRLTGMAVLYNNMLQSLFGSQIKTLGVVFLSIMAMFLVLFRSIWLALIGMFPNLLAAGTVLGMMGWIGIPLDMMTITVAAISVGIAVDNTIHYMYRFRVEFSKDRNYREAMHRSHRTIGRAMFYTSLTIIIGFSILALSNFIPTIYFGIFTGLAMAIALFGALTLLPRLIVSLKPLGPEGNGS